MGLLSSWVESLDYQYQILPTCTHHKSPRSTCENCIDACDEEAIVLKSNKLVIDYEKCTECGKCLSTCPVQAIEGIFPKREIHQTLLVAHTNSPPTIKELLVYAKKGITGIISEHELNDNWKPVIKEANEKLLELEQPLLSIQHNKNNLQNKRYTRRELFFSWKKETNHLMKELVPAKWRFNQTDLDLSKYYPNHQFAKISLDIEKCTLCGACEKLCDRHCFQMTEHQFSISPQACSACRLCEDTCPQQAIVVEKLITKKEEMHFPIFKKICPMRKNEYGTLIENDDNCYMCCRW